MEKFICIKTLTHSNCLKPYLSDYKNLFTIRKIYDLEECDNQHLNKGHELYLYKVIADDGYSRTLPKNYVNQIFISLTEEREKKLKKILHF